MLVTGGLGRQAGALTLRGLGVFASTPTPPTPQPGGGSVRRRPQFVENPPQRLRRLTAIGPAPSVQAHASIGPPLAVTIQAMGPAPVVQATNDVVDEMALVLGLL